MSQAQKKLDIIVSVDWEGRNLTDDNLKVMSDFRDRYEEIPIQQFLNASYYSRGDMSPDDVTERINRVLRPGDEHGLHIHGWKSLFAASGVEPKEKPTLFNDETPLKVHEGDWGHEVCIDAYTTKELRAVIQYSVERLTDAGFDYPKSFRAGAWLAAPNVLEALAAEGFIWDCSAAWIEPLQQRWGKYYLYDRNSELWPGVNQLSQPWEISTPAGPLQEIPNNGCLADYVSADCILDSFQKNVDLKSVEDQPKVLSIGFHQETAEKFLHVLDEAIPRLYQEARRQGVVINFRVNRLTTSIVSSMEACSVRELSALHP
ncbi:MAG: hypothetical protein CMP10_17940 [Zetaproteobacteria bacterium]|nr:hypothetical protein [Pseudobdellovibrionaceae bacterium]